jgi:hypothetical protein
VNFLTDEFACTSKPGHLCDGTSLMFSRKETQEDRDDGSNSKRTLLDECTERTKEYARLVHALSIQTLDEHLNLSLAGSYVNLERPENQDRSSELGEVPSRKHKRKKDFWPLPIPRSSDTSIGPCYPQSPLTNEAHTRQQRDSGVLFSPDPQNVHQDLPQAPPIRGQQQPIMRLYDYDVAHHMAIYENDLLRNTLERLIRQRLTTLGRKTRESRGFVEALILRDSLQLIEELLEIMGTLRDYLMQNLSSRMSSRLRPGDHRTVFRAARLIHLEESLLKRAQDRTDRILNSRTYDIEEAWDLPNDHASDYSGDRGADGPESRSFGCLVLDRDFGRVGKSTP